MWSLCYLLNLMKLSKAHFVKGLDNKLEDIYSFFAEESMQISELTDEVVQKAKSKGFEDKQTFIITKDTDWSFLSSQMKIWIYLAQKKS